MSEKTDMLEDVCVIVDELIEFIRLKEYGVYDTLIALSLLTQQILKFNSDDESDYSHKLAELDKILKYFTDDKKQKYVN